MQLAAEGSWYWYAHFARSGTRLYSGLHFSLQPLFVIEAALFQRILGTSWLASKVPALLHLLAFAFGIYLLSMKSNWFAHQKAIVFICAFFMGIKFEAYRFDDYHVLADIFYLYALLSLISLEDARLRRRQFATVCVVGLLCGLTITTRINDGLALAAFSTLIIFSTTHPRRVVSLVAFFAATAATIALTVYATGDSLVAWATYSVLHVGAIKGGTAQFASDPINVFSSAYQFIVSDGRPTLLQLVLAALSWSLLITTFSKKQLRPSLSRLLLGLLIIAYCLYFLFPAIETGTVVLVVHATLIWVALLGALFVVCRACNFVKTQTDERSRSKELLFLLPLFMIASGSLSSAGSFADLYIDSAFLILLFPLVWPFPKPGKLRSIILVVLVLTAVSGLWYRFNDPASWIDYKTSRLFADRQIVNHVDFGPMIIDDNLLRFITPICAVIDDGEAPRELLSIPWAYANYYCDVAPWHGFVQTWYDTSSASYIEDLITQLRTSPPKWIFYQRQMGTLAAHEQLYNQGLALPQRSLDNYIVGKINDGEWRVVHREAYGSDSDWILLRTKWALSHGPNLLSNPTAAEGLSKWHAQSNFPLWKLDRDGAAFNVSFKGADEMASTLSHAVTFPREGPVRLQARIGTNNIASGHHGYSVDLYDLSADEVVGSLGWSNFEEAPRDQGFMAKVVQHHSYQIRLQYQATGDVSFSHVAFFYGRPDRLGGSADVGAAQDRRDFFPVQTTTLTGWTPSTFAPIWSSDLRAGGSFVVTHATAERAESTLYHNIHFSRTGPVTIQVTIGAQYLELADGYGYVVDLYDPTSDTILGSLGVPAVVSSPQSYSFGAAVERHHTYELRLRYDAARGRVTFSHLKIEEGTRPTAWSDEATNRR